MLNNLLKISKELEMLKNQMNRAHSDKGLDVRFELEYRLLSEAVDFVQRQMDESVKMLDKVKKYL